MSATIPEPTAWQRVLHLASVLLLAIGGGMLASGLGLLKGRRLHPPKPSLGRMAIGGAAIVVGAVLWAMLPDPKAEPETIAADRFSSSSAPSLSLVAPAPWRLDYDRPNGRLVGLRGGAHLMIESSLVTDNQGPDRLLDGIAAKVREQGVVTGEPFHQAIDGLDAIGVAGVKAPGSTAVWIVNRIASFYTILVCTSDNTQDARTTCDPILSTLHWRAPGPL